MNNNENNNNTINANNNVNNNDLYYDDNGFNNQGIVDAPDTSAPVGQQFPNANKQNAVTNFGKGLAQGFKQGLNKNNPSLGVPGKKDKNNPAMGQKKPDSSLSKNSSGNKSNSNNKGNSDNKGNNNSNNSNGNNKNGSNNNSSNRNPLPGGGQNKKDDRREKIPKNGNKNDAIKTAAKAHPVGRVASVLSKIGLGKSKEKESGKAGSALNEVKKQGIKKIWMMLPFQAKIAVVTVVPLFILGLIFVAMFGTTTSILIGSTCETDSSSTYNGEDYTGSSDVTKFMCTIQKPLGNASYTITSTVSWRWGRQHMGIDLAVPTGTTIYAAQAGEVVEVLSSCPTEGSIEYNNCSSPRGNYVKIKHGDSGIVTYYEHMKKNGVLVKEGQTVAKGQKIGISGSSGNSTGSHLHFQVDVNGKYQKIVNDYFKNYSSFKKQCGTSWDGELAGDSANAENDTSKVEDSTSDDTTSISSTECCDTSSTSSSSSSGSYCPNGVTVVSGTGGYKLDSERYPIGTFSLDEYVQMVVAAENANVGDEAIKAQAVAARTYTLSRTNNCKKSIRNSIEDQTALASKLISDKLKKVVSEVNGSIMLYNGKYFSAEYSSFEGDCSGSTCIGNVEKLPSNKTTTFTMPRSYVTSFEGHGRGMSQNGADYMADQGKKYDEILKFFYADGIEITGSTSNTCVIGGDGYSGKIWKYYQTDYKKYSYCGKGTISRNGCGPTAMAMAVSTFLNEKHDPVELAKFSCKNGHVTSGGGSAWTLFADAGKKYGLNVQQLDDNEKSDAEVITALNTGKKLVIVSVRPSVFTRGGHFILLTSYKDGDVFVQDPNGYNPSKLFSFKKIVAPAAKQYWIISKG